MKVVNPYYARESSVGSVFDVATWHPPKPVSFGFLVTVALTVGCAAATLCAFFPELLGWFDHQWSTELQKAIGEAKRDYAWAVRGGAALGLLVTYALFCITVADQALPFRGEFYFRAGPGGFSLRLPNGLDRFRPWYQILQLDAPWPEIASWRIVQHKQLGSLSPNAGNLHADLHLKLANGKRYLIPLAWFREPARVIWRKIEDAVEMVPMQFTPETLPTDGNDAGSISKTDAPDLNDGERRREDRTYYVSDADELYQEVQNALSRLIQCGDAFVIVSDSTNDKFVQFCDVDGTLFLDLPLQALSDDEMTRLESYLDSGIDNNTQNEGVTSTVPVVATATETSYQVNLGIDTSRAARMTLDIFDQIYRVRTDTEFRIDEQSNYIS